MTEDRTTAGRIARRKAKAALAVKHPTEYKALVAAELKALGIGPKPTAKKTSRKAVSKR